MLGQRVHHLRQAATKLAVQPTLPALLGKGPVDEGGVDHDLVRELLGQPLQPLALHRRPGAQAVDPLHGLRDPLLEGPQRLAQRSLPEQLQAELAAGLLCGRSKDGAEALRAAIEKRPAHFSGQ